MLELWFGTIGASDIRRHAGIDQTEFIQKSSYRITERSLQVPVLASRVGPLGESDRNLRSIYVPWCRNPDEN